MSKPENEEVSKVPPAIPPRVKSNGHGPLAGLSRPSGRRLAVAANHLSAARIELLHWVRDSYVQTNNVAENVEDIMAMLKAVKSLENLGSDLDVRATILGRE